MPGKCPYPHCNGLCEEVERLCEDIRHDRECDYQATGMRADERPVKANG